METLQMAMDEVRFELLKINTYVLVDHHRQKILEHQNVETDLELVLNSAMMAIFWMEIDVCGDCDRISQEKWDDGINISGDGCSSTWIIESFYKWSGGSSSAKDNGEGTLYYKNGDRYEGGWKDGDYYGQGILYKDNGDKYTGIWDDNYDGQGEINYKDGKKYTGQWKIET